MEIWKGKGSRADVASYRDVAIADSLCRTTVSFLRGAGPEDGGPSAEGGLSNGCTALVNLQARAFVSVAEVQNVCLALIFIDVRSAFASVVRRVALPASASDAVWRCRLSAVGFSLEDIEAIFLDVSTAEAWAAAGASPHLLRLLVELHTHSWFSTEGLPAVVECASGALAGTPLADIVFIAAFNRVVLHMHVLLRAAGLQWEVVADDVEAFLGVPDLGPARCTADHVDYVDDMLVPIAGPASDLMDKVRTASGIIHMSFARFWL